MRRVGRPAPELAVGAGAEFTEQDITHWRLYAACQPTKLAIDYGSPSAYQHAITEEIVRVAAETYLRDAGIALHRPAANTPPLLRLVVILHDMKAGTKITVRFMKAVQDFISNKPGYATTWDRSMTVPYGQPNGANHLKALGMTMQAFVGDYSKQNGGSCP